MPPVSIRDSDVGQNGSEINSEPPLSNEAGAASGLRRMIPLARKWLFGNEQGAPLADSKHLTFQGPEGAPPTRRYGPPSTEVPCLTSQARPPMFSFSRGCGR